MDSTTFGLFVFWGGLFLFAVVAHISSCWSRWLDHREEMARIQARIRRKP
jgi:hypothetical protein